MSFPEPSFLTVEEVRKLHRDQIRDYGGRKGLRDKAALEAALAVPQATYQGAWLHPTIPAMAAAYLFHICQNHPFLDGNKRTGADAAIVFLLMNGWDPGFSEDTLYALVMGVATGKLSKAALTKTFEADCQPSH